MSFSLYSFLLFFAIVSLACTINATITPAPSPAPQFTPTPTRANQPTFTPGAILVEQSNSIDVDQCTIETSYAPGNLNLRTCGGMDCPIITTLPQGQSVTVLERNQDNWWYIRVETQYGYVNAEYLNCEDKNAK